jgi:hypothetical protein
MRKSHSFVDDDVDNERIDDDDDNDDVFRGTIHLFDGYNKDMFPTL